MSQSWKSFLEQKLVGIVLYGDRWIMGFHHWLSKKSWAVLLAILSPVVATVSVLGAQYQWNFNNVEQGSNSTSNAKIEVSGDGVKKSKALNGKDESVTALGEEKTPELAQAEVPSPTPLAVKDPEPLNDPKMIGQKRNPWRVDFGVNGLKRDGLTSQAPVYGGAELGFSYFPVRELGLRVFSGNSRWKEWHIGLEAEVLPIRVSLFGLDPLLEIGFVTGVSNLNADRSISLHGGGKAIVHLGERWALTGALRTHVAGGNQRWWMGDTGLAIYF